MYYMKKTVQVKLDDKTLLELKKEADARSHSISSMVRFIVKEFLKTLRG